MLGGTGASPPVINEEELVLTSGAAVTLLLLSAGAIVFVSDGIKEFKSSVYNTRPCDSSSSKRRRNASASRNLIAMRNKNDKASNFEPNLYLYCPVTYRCDSASISSCISLASAARFSSSRLSASALFRRCSSIAAYRRRISSSAAARIRAASARNPANLFS